MLEYRQIITAAIMGLLALSFIALSLYHLVKGILTKMNGQSHTIFVGRSPVFLLTIHAFALLMVITLIYSFKIEPGFLATKKYEVASSKVKEELRICLISDIHWPNCRLKLDNIVKRINAYQPDMLLCAGDLAANGSQIGPLVKMFQDIECGIKIGCAGNVSPQKDKEICETAGMIFLDDNDRNFVIKGEEVYVLGLPRIGSDPSFFAPFPINALRILLCHYPENIPEAQAMGFDLYLCGHTHGGQVRLPFAPNLFIPGELGKSYPVGYYEMEQMSIVVTKGLGMAGGMVPRMRLFCPPEVCFIKYSPPVTGD